MRWTLATDTHHCIHGYGRRELADKDGLTVRLCKRCHTLLHDKGRYDKELQQIAEEAWLKHNNATIPDFINRYGKNYLDF